MNLIGRGEAGNKWNTNLWMLRVILWFVGKCLWPLGYLFSDLQSIMEAMYAFVLVGIFQLRSIVPIFEKDF